MTYQKILTVLKRYSFESKMMLCHIKSKELLSENGIKTVGELYDLIYPWEIEEFLLFALMSDEWKNQDLITEPRRILELINEIRNFNHPTLLEHTENKFLKYFIMVTGQSQFPSQTSFIYKMLRYTYFFTFKNEAIDMEKEYNNKFKCNYMEVLNFGLMLHAMYFYGVKDSEFLNILIKKYPQPFQLLSIELVQFREKQKIFTPTILDYKYGFKYFTQFPIIISNGIYFLPIPHLIITSCTTAMLYRLTEGNNALRDRFGKNVLESYVYDLMSSFGIYDYVTPEQEYRVGRYLKRSPDVMIKDGDYCVLIDCKTMVLPSRTRLFDDAIISDFERKVVEAIKQVYKNISTDFNKNYYPFGKNVVFNENDIFGVIVVLEDTLCERRNLYEKVAQSLNLDLDSVEYKYISSNIKVVSLLELEQAFIKKNNIINGLKELRDDETKMFDICIPETEEVEIQPLDNHLTQVFMQIVALKDEIFRGCSIVK